MKKYVFALLAGIVVSGMSLSKGTAAEGPHFLEGGITYYNFDYAEDLDSPSKSTEDDWLQGFRLAYGYHGVKRPLYGRLLLEYTDDKTDFDGTNQAGSPVKGETDNEFITWEGVAGYTFRNPKGFRIQLTPYAGLGYRYWERGLGGVAPLTEEYSWKYIPLGIRADYRISAQWSVALDVAARIMFDGRIQVNLSETDPLLNDPEADLGNETGYRVDLPFHYRLGGCWSLVLAPWYEHSSIGKSEDFLITAAGIPILIGFEPDSDTDQYGIGLSVRRSFGKVKKGRDPKSSDEGDRLGM